MQFLEYAGYAIVYFTENMEFSVYSIYIYIERESIYIYILIYIYIKRHSTVLETNSWMPFVFSDIRFIAFP